MNTNKLIKVIIPLKVKVRKYEVDIEKLKQTLIEHKLKLKLSNKYIANQLNKPLTLVEHWFRKDNCLSIPDVDVWYNLKELLNIYTNEFDKSITTFEERDGIYEKSNRVYDINGLCPTLTAENCKNERFIVY